MAAPCVCGGGGRILNIGCGTIPLPGQNAAWRIINLEVERKPFPNLVLYDGSIFPFEASSFDAALCLDVIEHVRDDRGLLCEIARVLKPQGGLVLTTPAMLHDFREIKLPLGRQAGTWFEAESQWGHVRSGYEIGSLVSMCHDAGLVVVGIEKYGGTIAQALYQLWYLRDMAWLFSMKLLVPRLAMELALRLDQLLWRNRGCSIALFAIRADTK
ncbi:class I SAM-dependent methyltransferase [bacterium]|nr:class I SAM-dependent methyltransferase [bacterium]